MEMLVFPVLTQVFSRGSNFPSKDMQVKVPVGVNSSYPFLCVSLVLASYPVSAEIGSSPQT